MNVREIDLRAGFGINLLAVARQGVLPQGTS